MDTLLALVAIIMLVFVGVIAVGSNKNSKTTNEETISMNGEYELTIKYLIDKKNNIKYRGVIWDRSFVILSSEPLVNVEKK